MAGADIVAVLLPDEAARVLRVLIADGAACDQVADAEAPIADSLAGRAFISGEPCMVTDPAESDISIVIGEYLSLGPVAAVPIGASGRVCGALSLGKRSGRIPFSRAELRTLHSFAGQAAIALELAESRMDAERLSLLEDRDRIAKDLHDVVIQRLFAVAMTLMSTMRLIERPEASARVQNSIDELDGTSADSLDDFRVAGVCAGGGGGVAGADRGVGGGGACSFGVYAGVGDGGPVGQWGAAVDR